MFERDVRAATLTPDQTTLSPLDAEAQCQREMHKAWQPILTVPIGMLAVISGMATAIIAAIAVAWPRDDDAASQGERQQQ
jgi:hypothetical protein